MNEPLRAIPPTETPARFTVDEFMQVMNALTELEPGKLELVEGVIVKMSPALSPHMHYQREICFALRDIFVGGAEQRVVQPELSLQLGVGTLREADIGVLAPFDKHGRFPDPATVLLVVEVADASFDNDMTSKHDDYARAFIPHYWVVDIERRRVHAMSRPLDGAYAERRPYDFGEPVPVPDTDRAITID